MAGQLYAYAAIPTPSHAAAAFWWVLLLVSLPVLLALARVATHWVWNPRFVRDVCGRCGYSTRGLPGTICPECGADLRVVGTRRFVANARGRGALLASAAWTILLLSLNAAYWRHVELYLLRLLHGVDYYSATAWSLSPPPPMRDVRWAALGTAIVGGIAVIVLLSRRRPRGLLP